jgi:hypothetical protein
MIAVSCCSLALPFVPHLLFPKSQACFFKLDASMDNFQARVPDWISGLNFLALVSIRDTVSCQKLRS